MDRMRKAVFVVLALVFASGFVSGCRRTFVVVPQRDGGYGPRDTLYGRADGNNVRVTFRHDTTWRVDTITFHQTDTLWRGGTRIIRDTVVRRDTLVVPTAIPIRRDTIYLPDPRRGRDTVYLPRGAPSRVDTLRITIRDTLRIVVRDTVRVGGPSWRTIHVPPGHFPPDGQCRVWIAGTPPGRQAEAAACDQLGAIPAGAFVLFGGAAYDFDHDWVAESQRQSVPPQIVALKRRGGR